MCVSKWINSISLMIAAGLLFSACAKPARLPLATEARPSPSPLPSPSPMPTPTRSELPKGPDAVWNLVVIGDSSIWGLGEAFASQIKKDIGVEVVLEDFAMATLSAGEVLEVLQTGKSFRLQLEKLPSALKEAEVVVMFVNPLFSIDPEHPLNMDGCFDYSPPDSCGPETFEKYTADMEMIWAKIYELRAGQATILRATDIYNPLVSGWNKNGIFEDCTKCWEAMSNAARLAAEAYQIPFLSRYDAFNGPDHSQDPRTKGYILSDGEHPTDLACQYTAELLSRMGYEPVSRP
jgi:hypothetical protein